MKVTVLTTAILLFVCHALYAENNWKLVYHETFDTPFNEPDEWTEDKYEDDSKYNVGAFDENGDFFHQKFGAAFQQQLNSFRSFRKSYAYGEDGWLTVELYGRDTDKDGTPETGGSFTAENGKAVLRSRSHTDGAIITSTKELPSSYRIEVTMSNINFGGERDGSWFYEGKKNGYDGDEMAGPWKPSGTSSVNENGVYFLCITDYPNPAPHNNVFIHHHRKVVMDSDNNYYNGNPWSKVWNPNTKTFERDGSHYLSMIWLNGENFGNDNSGNDFISHTPNGWEYTAHFTDKYLDNETYLFTIERKEDEYTMSATGKFYYAGDTTYKATRKFRDTPTIWHYNQTPEEYDPAKWNEVKTFNGNSFDTWPENSAFPDHFFFGDPHINYYEGSAEYDDLKLYLPDTMVASLLPQKQHTDSSQGVVKALVGASGEMNLTLRQGVHGQKVRICSLQGKLLGEYTLDKSVGGSRLHNYSALSEQYVLIQFDLK